MRTRDLVARGQPVGALKGRRWQRVSRGLYVPAVGALTLTRTCHAVQRLLPPGSMFGELTAATLYGWWLPALPAQLPVTVVLPPSANRLRRPGIRARRSTVDSGERRTVGGLPLTSPVRTLLDLAGSLGTIDLVVLADSAVRAGHCSASDLLTAAGRRGARGVTTFRRAVPLVDARSESPWETVLRLLHVLTELPPVEPQVNLLDEHGCWVARADLMLVGTRQLHEYDGAVHRDRAQHERDLAREKRLSRAGYIRYGYTATEVMQRPGAVVRDAEAAFSLDHQPGRLAVWHEEIQHSLFTPVGRARLRQAWRA